MKKVRIIIIIILVVILIGLITVKPVGKTETVSIVETIKKAPAIQRHKTAIQELKTNHNENWYEKHIGIPMENRAERDRIEAERLAEEQRIAEEKAREMENARHTDSMTVYDTGGHLTPSAGVYYYGDQKETYYNLPMDGVVSTAWNNGISGDYWVRDDGCKMLGEYIILACNRDVHPYGSIVQTSLGAGISLDTGGFAYNNPYQVDIAVNW